MPSSCRRNSSHTSSAHEFPRNDVEPFGEVSQWRLGIEQDADVFGEGVGFDLTFGNLEWPGFVVDFPAENGPMRIAGVQAIPFDEELFD